MKNQTVIPILNKFLYSHYFSFLTFQPPKVGTFFYPSKIRNIRANNAAPNATGNTHHEKPIATKATAKPAHQDKQTGQFTNVIIVSFFVFSASFRAHLKTYSDDTIKPIETAVIMQIVNKNTLILYYLFFLFIRSISLFLLSVTYFLIVKWSKKSNILVFSHSRFSRMSSPVKSYRHTNQVKTTLSRSRLSVSVLEFANNRGYFSKTFPSLAKKKVVHP